MLLSAAVLITAWPTLLPSKSALPPAICKPLQLLDHIDAIRKSDSLADHGVVWSPICAESSRLCRVYRSQALSEAPIETGARSDNLAKESTAEHHPQLSARTAAVSC